MSVILSTSTSIFNPQSVQAEQLYQLNIYYILGASFILLGVIGLLIFVTVKFREKANSAPPQGFKQNKKVEFFMIGIPFLMVAFFFYLSLVSMKKVKPPRGDQPAFAVITGRQWWWQVNYKDSKVVAANEIHLPVGKKILLELASADVIHNWWVPAFGPKADMIPGAGNYVWVTIKKPGIYEGACSEFCGQQHAWMRIRVIAQKETDFNNWIKSQQKAASSRKNRAISQGAAIFQKSSCASCHTIRGTSARGEAGPDLTHLASRKTLLTGLLQNTPDNLKNFLDNPKSVKPGVHMPRYILKKDSINALVSYLTSLK